MLHVQANTLTSGFYYSSAVCTEKDSLLWQNPQRIFMHPYKNKEYK
jgi:hypothetical protein